MDVQVPDIIVSLVRFVIDSILLIACHKVSRWITLKTISLPFPRFTVTAMNISPLKRHELIPTCGGLRRLLLTVCVALYASCGIARDRMAGHVSDSVTGMSVPFCLVYNDSGISTMCNGEGGFCVYAEMDDTVEFRRTGYLPRRMAVKDMGDMVRLVPCANSVGRKVKGGWEVLDKVVAQLKKDYRKHAGKKGTYYTRTFQEIDGRKEMTEAFIEGNSAVNVRTLTPLAGRRYSIRDGKVGNAGFSITSMHHSLELGPMMFGSDFWRDIVNPLEARSSKSNYDVHVESIGDSVGDEKLYRIELEPKKDANVMGGVLYADAATFRLESFEGRMNDLHLQLSDNYGGWYGRNNVSRTVRTTFSVSYRHDSGFSEVESLAAVTEGEGIRSTSLMFMVGEETLASHGDEAQVDYGKKNSTVRAMPELVKRTREEGDLASEIARTERSRHVNDANYGDFASVAARQEAFGRTIPQEKVYVHMDNESYCLGDTIWFAAYTRQSTDDKPSKVSGVLYVELLNNDGYLVERKLVEMRNGRGNGFFALNSMIQYAGYYELRAYTRWQLNWGRFERVHSKENGRDWFVNEEAEKNFYRDYEKLYSRVFPVYDKPLAPGAYERNMTLRPLRRYYKDEPDKRKLLLTLYPEGGNLVEGVECRVAFEAAWSDGEWAEGCLICDGDTAHVQSRGRGVFKLKIGDGSPNKVTFMSRDGVMAEARMPKAEPMGVALSLTDTGKEIQVSAFVAGDLSPDSLAMVVTNEGKTGYFHLLKDVGSTFAIAKDSLPLGVNEVTVFDKRGRVYADRLFYVMRQEALTPTLSVSGMKDEYTPYERIGLTVTSHAGANTPLSISVKDGHRHDYIYDNAHIMAEMLLCSEIRGFVPDASWFFTSDDEEHRMALDLLMMTQGWRRFDWRDMAVKGEWDITEPSEKTPIIKGYVTNVPSWDYAWYIDNGDVVGEETTRIDSILMDKDNGRSRRPWEERLNDKGHVLIHSELADISGKEAFAFETTPKDGLFQIELPRIYGVFSLFISASDTTKWRTGNKYAWVCPAPSWEQAKTIREREYNIRINHPYPRFVRSYDCYQQMNNDRADTMLARGMYGMQPGTTLRELSVKTRRNGLRKFDDSAPAMMYDAYSAYSDAFDAGFANLYVSTDVNGQKNVARNLVNDFGVANPHHHNPGKSWDNSNSSNNWDHHSESGVQEGGNIYQETWYRESGREGNQDAVVDDADYIKIRYGLGPHARSQPQYSDIPKDSVYYPQYLSSRLVENVSGKQRKYTDETFVSPGERKDFASIGKLDKYLLYTDYCPRRAGSNRYSGSDVDVQLAVYPYHDGSRRMVYRDRQMFIEGFAFPAEFYSPDYSRLSLPKGQEDYRRTLYWNPDLQLDENGEAHVTFYNNSRTTSILVDAQGQCSDGTLLWMR